MQRVDTAEATWLTSAARELDRIRSYPSRERGRHVDDEVRREPDGDQQAALTLLIVGHTHEYSHEASNKEIVNGLGGAPLTSGTDYGYTIVIRNSNGTLTVTTYDYTSRSNRQLHDRGVGSRGMTRTTLAFALACVGAVGCRDRSPHGAQAVATVPRTTGPIKIDGEWDEPDWSKRALRGQFLGDDGQLARPSSDVRLLHDDKMLYIGLYAADDDIRSTDAFQLQIGTHTWSADALGKLTPMVDGGAIGLDRDGSVDNDANNDEEWLLGIAIPLAALELDHTKPTVVRASRCDTPKHQTQRCGSWTRDVTLD